MPRPNKPKILRKISDTQLTLNTDSYSNVTGITSTTSCSACEFCFVGKSNLRDMIDACVAVQGAGTFNGVPASPWTSTRRSGEGDASHSGGGAPAGDGCGSPFILTSVNSFNSGQWCFKRPGCSVVGGARTSTFFCSTIDSGALIEVTPSFPGTPAQQGYECVSGPQLQHQTIPSSPGGSGSLGNFCVGSAVNAFYDVCCVAGSGTNSGYIQSSFSNSLVPAGIGTFGKSCGSSGACTTPGWVHIKSTGRNDNVI